MKENREYPGQSGESFMGKVRIVTPIGNDCLLAECTNQISAFDVVLKTQIPLKGAILNLMAYYNMEATEDIVPNCLIAVTHPRFSLWRKTTPFPLEMVIRGYLVGSAWRDYKDGKRIICGITLPDNMVENQKFSTPIITPTTKAEKGKHDENISKEEIIRQGLVSAFDYEKLESYTYALFKRGTELAENNGLILVDTKYEFGKDNEKTIRLIDEVHTPDSSRYFYKDDYEKSFSEGLPPRQLSKEFVREWLIECGFQGRTGDIEPEFTEEIIESITKRYVELYQHFNLIMKDLPSLEEDLIDPYDEICESLLGFQLC